MMIIGVPREIKDQESRVSVTPAGVRALKDAGHPVLVERDAGAGIGIDNAEYRAAGAELVEGPEECYSRADLIVKVKEPLDREIPWISEGKIIFGFFHFAGSRSLTVAMISSKATCVAYETIEDPEGRLPLLAPMSAIAGRMAALAGVRYLEGPYGGRGILVSGVPGVEPATVVVLGAGVVGTNAARMAAGMGARVKVLDIDPERLGSLEALLPGRVVTVHADPQAIEANVRHADLLIGAVLRRGARAPQVVPRSYVRAMRPGSVIVDVSIDQGGCVETSRPTSHSEPTYVEEGVIHYCVPNMPGAVARTSTFALANVTLPYVLRLASSGLHGLLDGDPGAALGLNIHRGRVYHAGIAGAFGLELSPLAERDGLERR